MVRIKRFYAVLITTVLLLLSDTGFCAERFMVSIPVEKIASALGKGDRISECTIEILPGRVYSILKIPDDWWISSKDGELPQLKAWAFHGAGYLALADIKQGMFDSFLVIETWPEEGPFDIRAYLTIDLFMKEKPKRILIEKKDMVITPVTGR
jgi:hypothetical protein